MILLFPLLIKSMEIETIYTFDGYHKVLRDGFITIEATKIGSGIYVERIHESHSEIDKTNMLMVDLLQGKAPKIQSEAEVDAYMFDCCFLGE